ncbi:MAG: transposase family protein [Anaerolineae bacterium]|nr:transposase family protein [Anaerolineae bacterium]
MARRLAEFQQDWPRLPHPVQPKPGRRYLAHIPMLRLPWDISEPGHFEVDLVHHCGPTAAGEYAYTLQMIDVATGWSERRAILGRSYLVMEDAFRCILPHLPFPVLEIHTDNGSEFLNYHLLRFWGELVQGVKLSRSRPFHKNDNPRVEQKQYTLVRAYVGYVRLDTADQVNALNDLYDRMWLYYNLFQPVMHLVGKEVVRDAAGVTRVRRTYDQPTTPFDRLCHTDAILPEHRALLEELRRSINPRALREEIYERLEDLLHLPGATPGRSENVHHTLSRNRPGGLLSELTFHRTKIRK